MYRNHHFTIVNQGLGGVVVKITIPPPNGDEKKLSQEERWSIHRQPGTILTVELFDKEDESIHEEKVKLSITNEDKETRTIILSNHLSEEFKNKAAGASLVGKYEGK